jgi:hypothetical protein
MSSIPDHEMKKKTASILEKSGVEVYCPTIKEVTAVV